MRARAFLAGLLFAASAMADQTVAVGPSLSFSPSDVVIAPGEKVTWVWAGVYHSSTSDTTTGPEVWDSGIIFTGTFAHVFTTPGKYPYYCMVHSFPGGTAMNGTVTVAVADPTPPPSPSPTLAATTTPTSPPGTPVPTATPVRGASVPTLGGGGMLALALGLATLSYFLLSRRS